MTLDLSEDQSEMENLSTLFIYLFIFQMDLIGFFMFFFSRPGSER